MNVEIPRVAATSELQGVQSSPTQAGEAMPESILARFRKTVFGSNMGISLTAVTVFFIVWATVTGTGLVEENTFPSPTVLWNTFIDSIVVGYNGVPLYVHTGVSLFRVAIGVSIGLFCGILVGLLAGYFPRFDAAVQPFISFIRPIPGIAFVPLVILYFGIGELSKIFVIFIPAFTYSVLNSTAGVRGIPDSFRLAALNMELPKWTMFRRVILPYAIPSIMTGVKVSIALGWAVMVSAELVAAQSGLGYMIMDAANFYRIPYVYVGITVIGIIGLVLERGVVLLEKRTVHWANKG